MHLPATSLSDLFSIRESVPPKIVLAGRPFAGKDEHGKRLAQTLGCDMTVTSKVLGIHAATYPDSAEAAEILAARAAPRLASDAVTIAVMRQRLMAGGDVREILNGFPRNMGQFDALQGILKEMGMSEQDICLFLDITPGASEIRRQANDRGRPEDTAAKLAQRNTEFDTVTLPVVQAYGEAGRLITVEIGEDEANAPIEDIQARIRGAVYEFVTRVS